MTYRITPPSQLEQLKRFTTVVVDSGDFTEIARSTPRDATTNPSLVLSAVRRPACAPLLHETVRAQPKASVEELADALLVRFGTEILKMVPGRVSTEVDARLSFDSGAIVARAHRLMGLYQAAGVARERVLIKIAATWEGIAAARHLERDGVRTNLTLLFGFTQAVACADAGVQLISPFVGRIYDWAKANAGPAWVEADHTGVNDPGVQSVTRIHRYFKQHGIRTEVMGASFRNLGQIRALAGCDLLTISPELLAALESCRAPLPRVLDGSDAHGSAGDETQVAVRHDEAGFRFALNEDAMATQKLAEGIRGFVRDARALDALIHAARA
ncbi:MAG: transaldolase [Rhizobacter sp.]|nr:transaldolase [Rhizobacter sp.]